jgi:hypothetical protein
VCGYFSTPCTDAFVSKFTPDGTDLIYSTYLGASHDDYGLGLAVDASGAVYVAGVTTSPDFPTTPGAYDTTYNGGSDVYGDAFITKLDPTGSTLQYSTFLGGDRQDGAVAF